MYSWDSQLAPKNPTSASHPSSPAPPPAADGPPPSETTTNEPRREQVIDPSLESAASDPRRASPITSLPPLPGPIQSTDQPREPFDYNRMPKDFGLSSRRFNERRASPSPINGLASSANHSPSLSAASIDRHSVSTPPVRRTPPPPGHHLVGPPPMYAQYYPGPPGPRDGPPQPYAYPPPPFDRRYEEEQQHGGPLHHGHHAYGGPPPLPRSGDPYGLPYPITSASAPPGTLGGPTGGIMAGGPIPQPPVGGQAIIYTEDAATKLSDRVRRRCFNCCTTDTSTWRRSNLHPGKVLCNKCGLFERTHSRPRPDQFPHKRGPLAASTLRSRSPPQPHPHQLGNQLPPISAGYAYHQGPPGGIPPLSTTPPDGKRYAQPQQGLPAIGSWHHGGPPPPPPGPMDAPERNGAGTPQGRLPTPPGSARSQPLALKEEKSERD